MFPNILKQLRKSRKLNQATLAEALGMSQATITSWENGKRIPDIEMLVKLADYFGVTTDYLLGRTPMEIEVIHDDPPPLPPEQIEMVFSTEENAPSADELERRIIEIMAKEFEKRGL